jgi:hypothetical protein
MVIKHPEFNSTCGQQGTVQEMDEADSTGDRVTGVTGQPGINEGGHWTPLPKHCRLATSLQRQKKRTSHRNGRTERRIGWQREKKNESRREGGKAALRHRKGSAQQDSTAA